MSNDGPPLKLFIVAGEHSGDLHAANLARNIKQLEPDTVLDGLGGPRMAEAGVRLHRNMLDMAIMWFGKIHNHLGDIFRIRKEVLDWMDQNRPDAVVLVDFPGFNLYLARHLRKRRMTVIYYMAPQLWAWAPWRIRKLRKRVSHMLVALPFEEEYFKSRGMPTTYVGHPLFDHLGSVKIENGLRGELRVKSGEKLLVMLPGSRAQEIEKNLPLMLKTLALLGGRLKEIRAVVAVKKERREMVESILRNSTGKVDVVYERSLDAIAAADAVLTASGTATLEVLHFLKPMVVLYRVSPFSRLLSHIFMRTPCIAMVNLLAGRRIVPEMLTAFDRPAKLAAEVYKILTDEEARGTMISELAKLRRRLEVPGAIENAAREVLRLAREKPLPPQAAP